MSLRAKDFPWLSLLQRRKGVSGERVCLLNTGIQAEFVVDRYVAGEAIDSIADDYYVSRLLVEAAIRCCLLVNSTELGSKRALKRLDALVPMRDAYFSARIGKGGRRGSSRRRK